MQAQPWDNDPIVGAPPRQGAGSGAVITEIVPRQPRTPPAQTGTQVDIDAANLRRLELENAQREREAAAGVAAQAAEAERRASSFLTRALGANVAYEGTGLGPRSWVGENMQAYAPGLLNQLPEWAGNSPERQVADRSQDEFIAATLRQDSGAAIPEAELERQRRIYFPNAGDGPEAAAAARAARRRALEGLMNAAGRSLRPEDRAAFEQWLAQFDAEDQQAAAAAASAGGGSGGPRDPNTLEVDVTGGRQPASIDEASPEILEAFANARRGNPNLTFQEFISSGQHQISTTPPNDGQDMFSRTVAALAVAGINPAIAIATLLGDRNAGAAVRGAQDTAMLGTRDEVIGAFRTLGGGTVAENVERERGIDDSDGENNFIARTAGQVAGAVAIPTGVQRMAYRAGLRAIQAGATREAARAAARQAAVRQLTIEGAGFSGAYGAGSSEGDVIDRLAEGAVSAVLGAAAGNVGGRVGSRVIGRGGRGAGGADPDQLTAARAANELDIDMPRFIAGGPTAQHAGSRMEQTPIGGPVIRGARENFLDQAQAARDRIAGAVGAVAEPEAAAEAALRAARAWRGTSGTEGRRLYLTAERAADGAFVSPQATMQTLGQIIREQRAVPGGTSALPVIERYAAAFEDGGGITINGAREMRTELRQRLGETMTPRNADRLTRQIMDSVGEDIETSLRTAGRDEAIAAYRAADQFWARRMGVIEDAMAPIVGRDGNASADVVARNLQRDARGHGGRLGTFLREIPQQEAATIRASLISRLGNAGEGAQNAAGDAFSLDTFLTNWNQIRGAREQIFPRETVRALNQLAVVASRSKVAGGMRNRSNTGSTIAAYAMGAPALAGAGAAITSPTTAAALVLTSIGLYLRQYRGARLLASPEFARRLAATPMNPRGASVYWSRPWVSQLLRAEPALASEISGFQQGVVRALGADAAPLAAESGEQQQQRPNR